MWREDVHRGGGEGSLLAAAARWLRVRCRGALSGPTQRIPCAGDPVRPPAAERHQHRLPRRRAADVPRPLSHPAERTARRLREMTLVVTADDLGLSPGLPRGTLEP